MPIWGEAPTIPIKTKICMAGNLADVITCAKFQDEIFRGYDFTGGRMSHFPIDFCMGLTTVQRDCAACDAEVLGLGKEGQVFILGNEGQVFGLRLGFDLILGLEISSQGQGQRLVK